MSTTHIVIMAGGVGSRLFPISTPDHPKQFIDFLGVGKSLIQLTYDRFLEVDPQARFWVVTSEKYVHFVHEQLPDIPDEQILAEPVARNTAPCIGYACWKIRARYPDANIVVTPSDAYVPDAKAFAVTMGKALDFTAHSNAVVCVGIAPDHPDTEYGYIQVEDYKGCDEVSRVRAFKEKPSAEVAASYLAEDGYFWNAGIFVWNADTIVRELREHAPQIAILMDGIAEDVYTERETATVGRLFPQCDKISIDYAVMEKSCNVHVIGASWQWSDLGSFAAIEKITGKKLN